MITSDFRACFKRLLGVEGEYSDHPSDLGGKTRWGVTEALARAYGYTGDMKDYPVEAAERVAFYEFWEPLLLDQVAVSSSLEVAYEMFDTGYNMGPAWAVTFLQRALNALNVRATIYGDLKVDGRMGEKTLEALKKYTAHRGTQGSAPLRRALNALQGERYIYLCETRERNEDFIFGWLSHRVRM